MAPELENLSDDSPRETKNPNAPISERGMFLLAVLGGFLLAVGVSVSPLSAVFLSEYGVFMNAAVLFYLVAFGYGLKRIYDLRLENWKRWRSLAILSVLALFMAGEELRWGLPFFVEDIESWPAQSVRDVFSLAVLGVPEGASMLLVGSIAAIRWVLLIGVVYGLGAGLYFHARVLKSLKVDAAYSAFFYIGAFLMFMIAVILMKAETLPGAAVFMGCLQMNAALAFLMGALQQKR